MSPAEKIDLFKRHKADYVAPKKPRLITPAAGRYLALEGRGKPEPEEGTYHTAIGHVYSAAYTLKFQSKFAGRDYAVCKLESLWWGPKNCPNMAKLAPEKWRWKVLNRVPDFIDEAALEGAFAQLEEKGAEAGFRAVRLEGLEQGRCVQMLHIGPYEEVGRTIAEMMAFADAEGLKLGGPHHEIYLSDPRRVEPARLRTILRHPVS